MSGDRTVISWWQICCQCLHRMLLTTRLVASENKIVSDAISAFGVTAVMLIFMGGLYIQLGGVMMWCDDIYTPAEWSCWGGILVSLRPSIRPFVRLSVRPASRARSVTPTVLVVSISYLYILYFRRCFTCKVSCKISNFEFLANF